VYYIAKKYTSDHEWISVENGVGTFGITDFAQRALGDVVFVETPAVGDVVDKEGKVHCYIKQKGIYMCILDQVGAIESVKAASDIYSPVSGEIVNVNDALSDEPSLINSSPEEEGNKIYNIIIIIYLNNS
jgi:glycine cleavage system H protein